MPTRWRSALGRVPGSMPSTATSPAVALPVALEDLDRGRLAGAVGPEQPEHLAAGRRRRRCRGRPRAPRRSCAGPPPRSRRVRSPAPHHGNLPRSLMLCACIDIGSNTTRVLVAEAAAEGVREVLQQRAFTRIGRDLRANGAIPPERIAEIAAVVDRAARRGAARRCAHRPASSPRRPIRAAPQPRRPAGRAARQLRRRGARARRPRGGAAGLPRRDPHAARAGRTATSRWWTSAAARRRSRSGRPAAAWRGRARCPSARARSPTHHRRADPVTAEEIAAMRAEARDGRRRRRPAARRRRAAPSAAAPPRCAGSSGPVLDAGGDRAGARRAAAGTAAAVAARWDIDAERVHLLPAGILVLGAAVAAARQARCRSAAAGCARACCCEIAAGRRLTSMAKAEGHRHHSLASRTRAPARGSCACARTSSSSHADGVLDTEDIERVHDMRVASRRLRAVLEIFAACFPEAEYSARPARRQAARRRAGRAARPRRPHRRHGGVRGAVSPSPTGPASSGLTRGPARAARRAATRSSPPSSSVASAICGRLPR